MSVMHFYVCARVSIDFLFECLIALRIFYATRDACLLAFVV